MISQKWVQSVATDIALPTLSTDVLNAVALGVDADAKKVIELALKLQKRAKKDTLTVADINIALSILHQEPLYGYYEQPQSLLTSSNEEVKYEDKKIDLIELLRSPLPCQCPMDIGVKLHWLAVDGTQPKTSDNPEVVCYDAAADTSQLPREMAYFYNRVTDTLLSGQTKQIDTVCAVLSEDMGIQELCGYFSRFIFVHTRRNLKSISTLLTLVRATESLILNPHINMEACLHQILPSVLSCVVACKLGSSSPLGVTHFNLRCYSAKVVSSLVEKYGESYPDLLPRVCRTYLEAVSGSRKSLGCIYGGIVGLGFMGERVISEVLLNNFEQISIAISSLETVGENKSKPNTDNLISKKRSRSESPIKSVPQANLRCFEEDISGRYLNMDTSSELPDGGLAGQQMCESALLSILGWYIVKTSTQRGKLDPPKAKTPTESKTWKRFVSKHSEALVPYYVLSSSQLDYCHMVV